MRKKIKSAGIAGIMRPGRKQYPDYCAELKSQFVADELIKLAEK